MNTRNGSRKRKSESSDSKHPTCAKRCSYCNTGRGTHEAAAASPSRGQSSPGKHRTSACHVPLCRTMAGIPVPAETRKPEPVADSPAAKLRQEGNKAYAAFKQGGSCDEKRRNLHTAIDWYEKSIEKAEKDGYDERASAYKNIGVCYAALELLETKRATELYYLKHAARGRARALEYGELANKSDTWKEGVVQDLEATVQRYIERSQSLLEDTLDEILQSANADVANPTYHRMVCKHRIDQGERILNKCMEMVGNREYKTALPKLHGLRYPIEEAKRHAKKDEHFTREASVLEGETMSFRQLAEGLQSYKLGEDIEIKILETESVCLKSDLGFLALDYFKQAEVLARGEDVELVAMAQSKLGFVLSRAFNFGERAKLCFKEAINVSMTVVGNVHNRTWYQDLTAEMQRIRDEEERIENLKWENRRRPFLEQLKDELAIIAKLRQKDETDPEIINVIWEKFPPKHDTNAKKPAATLSHQKRLIKMNAIYHPDKINEEEMGTKYKVLCEEITSLINSKYNFTKMGC